MRAFVIAFGVVAVLFPLVVAALSIGAIAGDADPRTLSGPFIMDSKNRPRASGVLWLDPTSHSFRYAEYSSPEGLELVAGTYGNWTFPALEADGPIRSPQGQCLARPPVGRTGPPLVQECGEDAAQRWHLTGEGVLVSPDGAWVLAAGRIVPGAQIEDAPRLRLETLTDADSTP